MKWQWMAAFLVVVGMIMAGSSVQADSRFGNGDRFAATITISEAQGSPDFEIQPGVASQVIIVPNRGKTTFPILQVSVNAKDAAGGANSYQPYQAPYHVAGHVGYADEANADVYDCYFLIRTRTAGDSDFAFQGSNDGSRPPDHHIGDYEKSDDDGVRYNCRDVIPGPGGVGADISKGRYHAAVSLRPYLTWATTGFEFLHYGNLLDIQFCPAQYDQDNDGLNCVRYSNARTMASEGSGGFATPTLTDPYDGNCIEAVCGTVHPASANPTNTMITLLERPFFTQTASGAPGN